MHFGTKSYLKSNRNHTAKQTLKRTDELEKEGAVGPMWSVAQGCLKTFPTLCLI
jgi:hypothetical protein